MRRALAGGPIFFGLLVLVGLYLLRWTILQGPLSTVVENLVHDATNLEVEVGAIRGNLFSGIRVESIRTTTPNTDGLLRSLDIDEIRMRYRIADLLPFLALTDLPLPRFTSPAAGTRWLEDDEFTTAHVVSNLSRTIPRSFELELGGSVVLNGVDQRSSALFDLRLPAGVAGENREMTFELTNIDSSLRWPGTRDDSLALVFTLAPGRLRLRTDRQGTDETVSLEAVLESTEAGDQPALSSALITVSADRFHLHGEADERSAVLTATLPADDRSTALVNRTLNHPSLAAGALRLDAVLRLPPATPREAAPRSIVAELFSAPVRLMEDAELSGTIDARSWRFSPVAVEKLVGSAQWSQGRLTVGASNATFTVEGLDLATSSEGSSGVAVDLGGAAWNPRTGEADVEELIVEGGGGRVRIDGIVLLPPNGSGIEHIGGTLVGRLSVAEPDEVAALLARLGLVPELPEGYSAGDEIVVDFGIEGARDTARIDVEARVSRPMVPGLAFETVEVDAAIAPDSVSVSRLTLESELGTIAASGTFASDRLALEIDARAIPFEFLVGLLDPALSTGAAGTVSVRATAEGDPRSPTIGLRAEGDSLAIEGENVTVVVDVRQEAGEIRLVALTIDIPGLANARGSGSVPVSVGTGGLLTGDLTQARLGIEASLQGAGDLWPDAMVELSAALDGSAGSLRLEASGFDTARAHTIVGIDPITEFHLAADIADVLAPSPKLTAELTSGTTLLAWLEATPEAGWTGEVRLPVAELSHFVPGIDLPGGGVRGSLRADADGSAVRGEIELQDLMVKVAPQVPTVSSLTGSLTYEDGIIRTQALSGEMGGEPVTFSGSYSFADNEVTPVQIRVGGRNALLVRSPDMQVRSDIDVALAGRAESTRMSGSIDVTGARYTRPIQLFSLGTTAASPSSDLQLPGIEADWARSVLLDVDVNADRTIVIDNNLFTGILSAYLTIGGNAAVPRPTGRVFTDVGTIRLPSARLEVEELELHFPAETASAPQLRLIATTQVQGYAMNVTVSGSVPSVEVRIVSSPHLPTDEAILLLTTGTRRSDLSFTPNVSGTLTALGEVFGRQILSQLSDQIADEDRRFLERIEFEIERERETGRIGEIGVEYQLGDEERWFLLFNRKTEESYTLQLAWRLWLD